jgi:hypothetical protein
LVSSDRSAVAKRVDFGRVWCSLAEGAVGSVLVVVDDVVIEAPFELAVVPDQGPVEQFASYGVHPSFCAAVRDRHAYLWVARSRRSRFWCGVGCFGGVLGRAGDVFEVGVIGRW